MLLQFFLVFGVGFLIGICGLRVLSVVAVSAVLLVACPIVMLNEQWSLLATTAFVYALLCTLFWGFLAGSLTLFRITRSERKDSLSVWIAHRLAAGDKN